MTHKYAIDYINEDGDRGYSWMESSHDFLVREWFEHNYPDCKILNIYSITKK